MRYWVLTFLISSLFLADRVTPECTNHDVLQLPVNHVATLGSTVELECCGSTELFWTKNGQINLSCDTCDVRGGSLIFDSITENLAGDSNHYACNVPRSDCESNICTKSVTICIEELVRFRVVSFEVTVGDTEVYIPYIYTCEIPTFVVTKNGVDINNIAGISTETTPSHVKILFQSINMTDAGEYEVLGQNKAGKVTVLVTLTVKFPPMLIKTSIIPGLLVTIGADMLLSCKFIGYPIPEVMWQDPQGIAVTSGVTEKQDASAQWISSQLTLTQLAVSDTGGYTCIATNILGSNYTDIQINVTQPTSAVNFNLTAVKSNAIHLTWTRPINSWLISKYRIEYRKYGRVSNDDTYWVLSSEESSDTTSSVISGLEAYTRYLTRVATVAKYGINHYSEAKLVKTKIRAPDNSPENITTRVVNSTTVEINWKAPLKSSEEGQSPVEYYRLWWSQVIQRNSTEMPGSVFYTYITPNQSQIVNAMQTRYFLSNLLNGRLYAVQIQAYNNGGYGPKSKTIIASTTPGIDGTLQIRAEPLKEGGYWLITWEIIDPAIEIQYYKIDIHDIDNTILRTITNIPANTTLQRLTGLTALQYYRVCVSAIDTDNLVLKKCTDITATNVNTVQDVGLEVWIVTPLAGVFLSMCLIVALLWGILWACHTGRSKKDTQSGSEFSLSTKESMNNSSLTVTNSTTRHPYTGEQLPPPPRSCLKYHSIQQGTPGIVTVSKQVHLGTEL